MITRVLLLSVHRACCMSLSVQRGSFLLQECRLSPPPPLPPGDCVGRGGSRGLVLYGSHSLHMKHERGLLADFEACASWHMLAEWKCRSE